MRETQRIFESGNSVQGYGSGQEDVRQIKLERFNNESIEGGTLQGVEGGLRYDLFDHDDPEDLSCICDLPQHSQDLLWNDIDQSENA